MSHRRDSVLSELLDALRVGDGTDLVRELPQWVLQQLIDAEAAEVIGAGRYERTGDRVAHRNLTRPRVLSTKAGDLSVGIPEPRAGGYYPSLLEPRRHIDQVHRTGTSTRFRICRFIPGHQRPELPSETPALVSVVVNDQLRAVNTNRYRFGFRFAPF